MTWHTPVGAEFRELMDRWNDVQIQEAKHSQIRMLLDGQNFVMFFDYNDQVYGTTEQQRVTYSQLIDPNDEITPGWAKEAHFTAFNLTKGVLGKPSQDIFYKSDVKKIDIIPKEKAFEKLVIASQEAEQQSVMGGTQAIMKALAGSMPSIKAVVSGKIK